MLRALLLVLSLASAAIAAEPTPVPKELDGLEKLILAGLKDQDVPGLSVAVVKGDAVVYAKGFGLKKLGTPDAVDENTVFAIGSTTKAFTATALGLLVDEKKIAWDDKVAKHMPTFQLYDPYVTREITVRDLLCHRSGLSRHELMWYGAPFDRDELVRRLRLIKPDSSFRSSFGYQNMMYVAAGQIIPAVAKQSWDDYLAEKFFAPLGMKSTTTSVTKLSKDGSAATPHELVEGKVAPVPWKNIDNAGPAGSINSTAADMAKWLKFQLTNGKAGDKRIVAAATVRETKAAQMSLPLAGLAASMRPESHLTSYGFGWFLSDYRGKLMVDHGGNIDGMTALVAMLPEEKLGVVVLCNRDGAQLPTAVANTIFDRYLNPATPRDWFAESKTVAKAIAFSLGVAAVVTPEQVKDTKPSLPLAKYAGTYTEPLHAPLTVTLGDGDKLGAKFNDWAFDLEHWHFNTFRATDRAKRLPKQMLTFTLDDAGKVAELKTSLVTGEGSTFKRTGEPKASDAKPKK